MEWKFHITDRQIREPGKLSRYGYWATGWKTEKWLVHFRRRKEILPFFEGFRPPLGTTRPSIEWRAEDISSGKMTIG
jgi:hypothetical protein